MPRARIRGRLSPCNPPVTPAAAHPATLADVFALLSLLFP